MSVTTTITDRRKSEERDFEIWWDLAYPNYRGDMDYEGESVAAKAGWMARAELDPREPSQELVCIEIRDKWGRTVTTLPVGDVQIESYIKQGCTTKEVFAPSQREPVAWKAERAGMTEPIIRLVTSISKREYYQKHGWKITSLYDRP